MKNKILLVVVGVIAYVLGAKAGRERYEQIKDQAVRLWQDPQVREKASEAAEAAKGAADVAKDKAPEAKDRLVDGAKRATDKVKSDDDPADSTDFSDGSQRYGQHP